MVSALISSAIIGFWYWCTDQFIVQRVLSGKNEKEAHRGTIFGAYLKVVMVVSVFTAAPSTEKIQDLVFGTSTPEQKAVTRASWNKRDIIHTVIILCITAVFYWYFW